MKYTPRVVTAKVDPPRNGHCGSGVLPGWLSCNSPNVRPTPFTAKKSVPLPPQHGQLYVYSVPEPVWSVATPAPSPSGPLQMMLPLSSTFGSDASDPLSCACP